MWGERTLEVITARLQQLYPDIPVDIALATEPRGDDGVSVLVTAHTSSGCVLAGTDNTHPNNP